MDLVTASRFHSKLRSWGLLPSRFRGQRTLSGFNVSWIHVIRRTDTKGTAEYIRKFGMKCKKINKVSSGTPHIVDVLDAKKIALVINTGGGNSEHRVSDAIALRRATLKNKVPYCTNMSTAYACLEAIKSLKTKKIEVTALQNI